MQKRWVLIFEYIVKRVDDTELEPEIKLLTDAEFGDFMRGHSTLDTNVKFEVFELGKKTVWTN